MERLEVDGDVEGGPLHHGPVVDVDADEAVAAERGREAGYEL